MFYVNFAKIFFNRTLYFNFLNLSSHRTFIDYLVYNFIILIFYSPLMSYFFHSFIVPTTDNPFIYKTFIDFQPLCLFSGIYAAETHVFVPCKRIVGMEFAEDEIDEHREANSKGQFLEEHDIQVHIA
nr:hypothetical protein Itr_chr05CG04200 [Ipomoea trifida]